MKVVFLRCCLALGSIALGCAEGPKTFDELTTAKRVYRKVTVQEVEPDGIKILHESGLAKVRFEDLPEPLQREFGFDLEAAEEFRKELQLKEREAEEWQNRQAQELERRRRLEAERQAEDRQAEAPRYVTRREIQIFWLNNIRVPEKMAADYHQVVRARSAFIEEVKRGLHDLQADRVAAEFNMQQALAFNELDQARIFQAEIARISAVQLEEERQRREDQRAAELTSQLSSLENSIRSLNFSISNLEREVNGARGNGL